MWSPNLFSRTNRRLFFIEWAEIKSLLVNDDYYFGVSKLEPDLWEILVGVDTDCIFSSSIISFEKSPNFGDFILSLSDLDSFDEANLRGFL